MRIKHISQSLSQSSSKKLMRRNQITLFQYQYFKKPSQQKIKSNYIGIEDLKKQCENHLLRNGHLLKENSIKSSSQLQKQFIPLVWIDCRKSNSLFQKSYHQDKQKHIEKNYTIKNIDNLIQLVFSKGNTKANKKQMTLLQEQNNENQLENKFDRQNHNSDCKPNTKLTVQPFMMNLNCQAKANEIQQSHSANKQYKNALLIKCPLLISSQNQFYQNKHQFVDEFLSISIYLSKDIIVFNCLELSKNQIKQLLRLVQFKISKIKDNSITESKLKLHCILNHQVYNSRNCLIGQQGLLKKHTMVQFYEAKNQSVCELTKIIEKIKAKFLNSIFSSRSFKRDQQTLTQFFTKIDVSFKIIDHYFQSNKHKPINHFAYQQRFTHQTIKLISQSLLKQHSFTENKNIKQKLQAFYFNLIDKKKQTLPLPQSVLKFQLQTFVKEQKLLDGKFGQNNEKIQKLVKEYERRILDQNQNQIQKLVNKWLGQHIEATSRRLSSQMKPSSNHQTGQFSNQQYHIDCIQLSITQAVTFLRSNFLFLTDSHLQKYVYKQIYKSWYQKLYCQFIKLKTKNQKYALNQGEQIQKLKNQISKLKLQNNQLKDYNIIKQSLLKDEGKFNEQKNLQIQRLTKQLSRYKQKLIIRQEQLSQQVLLKNILEVRVKKSQQCQDQQGYSCNKQKNKQSSQFIDNFSSQSSQYSSQILKSFQNQLNKYKNQCAKLQQQTRKKQQILRQKQTYYQQKIRYLQESKNHQKQEQKLANFGKKDKLQQLQIQHTEKIQLIQKQNELKLQKYCNQIKQLERINKQKNQKIQALNQQIFVLKKTIFNIQLNQQTLNQALASKDKQIRQLSQFIKEKQNSLNIKQNDYNGLTQNIKQKIAYIQALEQQIIDFKQLIIHKNQQLARLKHQSTQFTSVNNTNYKLEGSANKKLYQVCSNLQKINKQSFVKFQKDISKMNNTSTYNKTVNQNYKILQRTPVSISKSHVSRSNLQRSSNQQLTKLMQQRLTIQKKKQKCILRQSMLNKIQKKLIFAAKSEIKQIGKKFCIQDQNKFVGTQSKNNSLFQNGDENNIDKNNKSGFIVSRKLQQELQGCRKRLF